MRVVTASEEILQPRSSTEYQPTQLQKGPIDHKLMDFDRSEQTDTSEIKVNHISGTRKIGTLKISVTNSSSNKQTERPPRRLTGEVSNVQTLDMTDMDNLESSRPYLKCWDCSQRRIHIHL